jgi:hypothetical protein
MIHLAWHVFHAAIRQPAALMPRGNECRFCAMQMVEAHFSGGNSNSIPWQVPNTTMTMDGAAGNAWSVATACNAPSHRLVFTLSSTDHVRLGPDPRRRQECSPRRADQSAPSTVSHWPRMPALLQQISWESPLSA